MKLARVVIASLAVVAMAVVAYAVMQPEPAAQTQVHRLFSIGPGDLKVPIDVKSGDMVQLAPFRFAVTPNFLKSTLLVRLEGDQSLQEVGQLTIPESGMGMTSRSVFLLARNPGKATISVQLIGSDGTVHPAFKASYTVNVHKDEGDSRLTGSLK